MNIQKVKLILLAIVLIFFTKITFADSPLTSTPFSEAYDDLQIISIARLGVMNENIAVYLHSESNTIDKKAAVINALGWDVDGNNNAQLYCNIIYQKNIIASDIDALNAGDAFVVGYLMAMGAYQNPGGALPFLKRAKTLLGNSFTVNIIYGLVKAQKAMDDDFCKVWKYVNKVFINDKLTMDMRDGAKKIIYDYMVSYKGHCQ